MKLTEEYFEARSEAMAWLGLKREKRNFAAGLKILVKSGYKPNVQKLLVRRGELPWTMEKLTSCLRDVVQVYYNPDDSRFDDVADADILNDETGAKPTMEEQKKIADQNRGAEFQQMPEVIQLLVKNFADAYKQRAKLSRQRFELGEDNDAATVDRRKAIGDEMDRLSAYMDVLASMRETYEKTGALPDAEKIEAASAVSAMLTETDNADDAADSQTDYKTMTLEKLKTRRKSLTNQITRKENMLLYQSATKQENENPMPDSPKRQKLLKQIETMKAEKSKVEYELAARS